MCDKDTEIDVLRSTLRASRELLGICHALILDELISSDKDTRGRAEFVLEKLQEQGIGVTIESTNLHSGHFTQNGL